MTERIPRSLRTSPRVVALLTVAGLTLIASTAAAYQFTCSPETDHPVGINAPNVFLMLDKSGSMNFASTDPSKIRWEAATESISEVTRDMNSPGTCTVPGDPSCDKVRFGFGWFSNSAVSEVSVTEDSNVSSTYIIDDAMAPPLGPGGGTQVGEASEVIRTESSLQDPARSNVAILISDGGPSSDSCDDAPGGKAQAIKAVQELCQAKTRSVAPVLTYSVGFGTDSSSDTNSLLAAAGGTGSCCLTSDCGNNSFDPCNASVADLESHLDTFQIPGFCSEIVRLRSSLACQGSIEATDPSDLKTALTEIAESASCTFPLDIPAGYPYSGAQPDSDATRVRIGHILTAPGLIEVPNIGDDPSVPDSDLDDDLEDNFGVVDTVADLYEDEGWYFTDSSRRFVTLTPQLCADIQATDVTAVRTQVACACTLSGPCTLTLGGWTPTQLANMRCAQGEWQCIGGVDTCVGGAAAQPEICNGLDDDCDGFVDNIKESWEKPMFSGLTLPPNRVGIDCNRTNSCMCPGGAQDDHSGTDFASFVDAWDPVCMCGGSLEAPQLEPEGEPHLDSDAACATGIFEQAAPLYLGFMLFAGFVMFKRRRFSR